MERMFDETPDDNLPHNIHPDHVLWHTNKLAEWLKFSGTSIATTEIQRSVMREAAKRLCHMADNPRNTEQDVIRVFVKLAEMLDEYCMGGTHQKHTLEDIRHGANDAANQARALLDMFPKQKDCARIAALEAELAAEREAVRALGDRVNSCEHMLACYRVGRRPSDIALDTARETADAVDNNPLARASVEKAGEHV